MRVTGKSSWRSTRRRWRRRTRSDGTVVIVCTVCNATTGCTKNLLWRWSNHDGAFTWMGGALDSLAGSDWLHPLEVKVP